MAFPPAPTDGDDLLGTALSVIGAADISGAMDIWSVIAGVDAGAVVGAAPVGALVAPLGPHAAATTVITSAPVSIMERDFTGTSWVIGTGHLAAGVTLATQPRAERTSQKARR